MLVECTSIKAICFAQELSHSVMSQVGPVRWPPSEAHRPRTASRWAFEKSIDGLAALVENVPTVWETDIFQQNQPIAPLATGRDRPILLKKSDFHMA